MKSLRKVIRQMILEKFELDKPLDTSLEDWKGYFEKADDLDKSIKDDFLAAREMADEALEMLDDERDNIAAAMEELEAKKKEAEAELKAQEEKTKQQDKKVMTLLQRLEKRGDVDIDELEAGKKDWEQYMSYTNNTAAELRDLEMKYSEWGFKNNRMDVVNHVMWYMNKRSTARSIANKFAFPQGVGNEVKARGVYPMVQEIRARYALLTYLKKKFTEDFFWQGDFPSLEQLIEKVPPPRNLGNLDK